MFGRGITLFRLLGFAVRVDASWLIIAGLVTWSLAGGLFAQQFPDLSPAGRWTMGVLGALGLFASIVVHEFAHSLVARRTGLHMRGITLFVFGGVAEMEDEPRDARSEFLMAIAGPLTSVAIGVAALAAAAAGRAGGVAPTVLGVLGYLGWINLALAAFNMLPAFPLDGGRVLRSALWAWKGDIRRATRIASLAGTGFGFLLMLLGVWSFISGTVVGGVWWLVLGIFLSSAAQGSYQRVVAREALSGETVARFMRPDPVTVDPSLPVNDLVEDVIYKHHFKMYPVTEGTKLVGCVTTEEVKRLPREEWGSHTVAEIVRPCSEQNTITPDADASRALAQMTRGGNGRLMVVDDSHLVGVLTLKDLIGFLQVKQQLEGTEGQRR